MFSKRAELGSPNYLKLVIGGDRNLTQKNIFLFAQALSLDASETEFFETLVNFEQATIDSERRFYEIRLAKLKIESGSRRKLESNVLSQEWYFPTVCVVSHSKKESEIQQFFRNKKFLSPSKIRSALEQLEKNSVLTLSSEGIYNLNAHFVSESDPKSRAKKQEQHLFDQIKFSLQYFHSQYRLGSGKYISNTITAPKGAQEIIKSTILNKLSELAENFDKMEESSTEILQVNLQVFDAAAIKGHEILR